MGPLLGRLWIKRDGCLLKDDVTFIGPLNVTSLSTCQGPHSYNTWSANDGCCSPSLLLVGCFPELFLNAVFALDPSHFFRSRWGMKISRWCSSSTSSRWWYQSASLSRDPCRSTTVLSHPHSRIAQGMMSYSYRWAVSRNAIHRSHSGSILSLTMSSFCPAPPPAAHQ